MEFNELILFLKKFDLFSDLDQPTLHEIAELLEVETFPKKAVVIHQGDYGDRIYFVVSGQLEAFIVDKMGYERTIGTLLPNDYFGELALLIDGFRAASVKSLTKCELLSLSRHNFLKILDAHFSISRKFNNLLSKRLGQTLNLVAEKKKNFVVILIFNELTYKQVESFENYFTKISSKTVLVINQDDLNTFKKIYHEAKDSYFLIKMSNTVTDELSAKADYLVSFCPDQYGDFMLSEHSSVWQIEHCVRVITQKTVGLALCSGGAPGIAHIGVLKKLHEKNIPIDYIIGTSAGALYGGCYAFGVPLENALETILKFRKQFRFLSIVKNLSVKFSSILHNQSLKKLMHNIFGDADIRDAQIPFAAIASDLFTGNTILLNQGKVADAMVASNAAPVLFEPVWHDEQLLIDGTATAPLPVQVLIDANMHIKVAVPISQLDLAVTMSKNPKLLTIYLRSRSMMAEQITQLSVSMADVIIAPELQGITMMGWENTDKIIKAGEAAAETAIKRINYLLHERH